ncbi:sulfotransferase [Bariatricus sp. HCP3S3_E12]|uniref:sulfotransferase n=1 Tax=Bariatricus sp. HCP3S3_E12 TaxID=3438906 RepID=UPI003F897A5E
MIVSTCGYGSTGASAVLDYLRGYDNVNLLDSLEFQLVHEADGVSDLKYHLTQSRERIGCNAAIKRFLRLKKTPLGYKLKRLGVDFDKLTEEYIGELVQVSWKGYSSYDPLDVANIPSNFYLYKARRALNKMLRTICNRWHYPRFQKRYFSLLSEEEFDLITKKYIQKLFDSIGFSLEKDIITDMLFSATNPALGMEFFDDAKAIVVMRDPRDLFLTIQSHLWTNGFQPWDSVEKFVLYYKSLIEHTVRTGDNRILNIQYEDLIYNYEETTQVINAFLGYDNRPANEFKYFDPDVSVRYTQRFTKATQYAAEIKYIEENLPQYLYDFKQYVPRKMGN